MLGATVMGGEKQDLDFGLNWHKKSAPAAGFLGERIFAFKKLLETRKIQNTFGFSSENDFPTKMGGDFLDFRNLRAPE